MTSETVSRAELMDSHPFIIFYCRVITVFKAIRDGKAFTPEKFLPGEWRKTSTKDGQCLEKTALEQKLACLTHWALTYTDYEATILNLEGMSLGLVIMWHLVNTSHTILCHTIPYHTIPYHTIPYHTIPYHTIPYHTIPYHNIFYHIPVIHCCDKKSMDFCCDAFVHILRLL